MFSTTVKNLRVKSDDAVSVKVTERWRQAQQIKNDDVIADSKAVPRKANVAICHPKSLFYNSPSENNLIAIKKSKEKKKLRFLFD